MTDLDKLAEAWIIKYSLRARDEYLRPKLVGLLLRVRREALEEAASLSVFFGSRNYDIEQRGAERYCKAIRALIDEPADAGRSEE